jgi:16S rRNA (cytosine967-C5)-methyltransferase
MLVNKNRLSKIVKDGIILAEAQNVKNLPGFAEGEFSVQDEAAQFAAELLELKPGLTVLDCCAAPGGKTGHILETEPQLAQVIAVDNNAKRVERIHENLQRLNLKAEVVVDDLLCFAKTSQNKKFERILLDAPCSATGVIRRHPEIKTLRQLSDLATLATTQLELLRAVWSLLKPNGILIYATCSILPQENEQVIAEFLKHHPDAKIIPIDAAWGHKAHYGRYCLPPETDGFYYAKLVH